MNIGEEFDRNEVEGLTNPARRQEWEYRFSRSSPMRRQVLNIPIHNLNAPVKVNLAENYFFETSDNIIQKK